MGRTRRKRFLQTKAQRHEDLEENCKASVPSHTFSVKISFKGFPESEEARPGKACLKELRDHHGIMTGRALPFMKQCAPPQVPSLCINGYSDSESDCAFSFKVPILINSSGEETWTNRHACFHTQRIKEPSSKTSSPPFPLSQVTATPARPAGLGTQPWLSEGRQ